MFGTSISRGDGEYGHLTLLAVLELITQGLSHISWGLTVNTNVGDGLCVGGVGGLCEGVGGGSAINRDQPLVCVCVLVST